VVLVVILLILIYRAPLLAFIPLATVFLSVQLALNVWPFCPSGNHYDHPGPSARITLFQGMQIYITILAYGAGIDYCLFLTARYKEELDRGSPAPEAITERRRCGCGAERQRRHGDLRHRHDGLRSVRQVSPGRLAIPIVLLLVLAPLDLQPALLRLTGRWLLASSPEEDRPDKTHSRAGPRAAAAGDG